MSFADFSFAENSFKQVYEFTQETFACFFLNVAIPAEPPKEIEGRKAGKPFVFSPDNVFKHPYALFSVILLDIMQVFHRFLRMDLEKLAFEAVKIPEKFVARIFLRNGPFQPFSYFRIGFPQFFRKFFLQHQ
jgi:hypothetical protein